VSEAPRVLFLFTSDTEANLHYMYTPDFRGAIDEHVWGRTAGREVGPALQMDMLDDRGFKGTFFVDVLSEFVFGEGSLQPVFDAIVERGHDVQLHLHTKPHLRFARDERVRALEGAVDEDDPAAFREAMELAIGIFERRAGRRPVAYRAGAYRIFDTHFPVLADLGIKVDSSVNPFKNSVVEPWMLTRTQPYDVAGVLEVPITWCARLDGAFRSEQLAPFASATAQLEALAALPAGSPATLCYIAHSFSFLRVDRQTDEERRLAWNATWKEMVDEEEFELSGHPPQMADMPLMRGVDDARIEVFGRVLDLLAARGDVAGITLYELARDWLGSWDEASAVVDPVPAYDFRAGRGRTLAARRYSASYLEALERGAVSRAGTRASS